MRQIWLLALLMTISAPSFAENKYVIDTLYISLREGPSDGSRALRTLKSGTSLEMMDEQGGDDFIKVRTPDGLQGWVKSKFLTGEPVASARLQVLEGQVQFLKKENAQLNEALKQGRKELREIDTERKRLESEGQQLKSENLRIQNVAAKPMELDKENQDLKKRASDMEKELEVLRTEAAQFKDTSSRDWFLIGAGVLLGGMIIGLTLPKVRWRRHSEWM